MKDTSSFKNQKFDVYLPTHHYDHNMWLNQLNSLRMDSIKKINSTERKILDMRLGVSLTFLESNIKYISLQKDLSFHHQSLVMFQESFDKTLKEAESFGFAYPPIKEE